MHFRLLGIEAHNFRGIKSLISDPDEHKFSSCNIFVGPNGSGKSTLLAAIGHLLPILRGDIERLFLDADFRFYDIDRAHNIKIVYYLTVLINCSDINLKTWRELDLIKTDWKNLLNTQTSQKREIGVKIEVKGQRIQEGSNRSFLNDQTPARVDILFTTYDNTIDLSDLLQKLRERGSFPSQRIRHQIPGSRIAPIYLGKAEGHAATLDREEMGCFDGLRARLVEVLKKSEIGKQVQESHPELKRKIFERAARLQGKQYFTDIQFGHDNILLLKRIEEIWQPWDTLSMGEQQIIDLAMLAELEEQNRDNLLLLIVEEPENNVHVGLQLNFLRELRHICPSGQIFISTHNTGFLERDETGTDTKNWLIYTCEDNYTEIFDFTNIPPTHVLRKLGATSKSSGQAKYRLFVEGPSDGIIFERILTKIAELKGVSFLPGRDLEIVPCGGPSTFRTWARHKGDKYPGLIVEAKAKDIEPIINIERPGVVQQWVLFDSDTEDSEVAIISAKELYIKLGSPENVKIIPAWYRTLESIYNEELWTYAFPDYERKESVSLGFDRLWQDPYDNIKKTFLHPPQPYKVDRKIAIASRVASHITTKWVKDHIDEMNVLKKLIDSISKSNQ